MNLNLRTQGKELVPITRELYSYSRNTNLLNLNIHYLQFLMQYRAQATLNKKTKK